MSTAVAISTTPKIADIVALIKAMEPGTRRILTGVTWEEYNAVNNAFVDPAGLRMSYVKGVLEIMSAGCPPEKYKDIIGTLVRTLTDELEIEMEGAGSTTLKLEKKQTGLEPDTSFYVQHATQMIGADKLDLTRDPPPDLAVEIDITHPSHNKRPIYARLGVPELWRYNGKQVEIFELVNGEYQLRGSSVAFPFLQAGDLTAFIEQSLREGQSKTLRAFRAWVKTQRPPTGKN